jgi:hypothetical protein
MQKELAAKGLEKLFPTDTWPQVGYMRVHGTFAGLLAAPMCIVPDQRSEEDCYEDGCPP